MSCRLISASPTRKAARPLPRALAGQHLDLLDLLRVLSASQVASADLVHGQKPEKSGSSFWLADFLLSPVHRALPCTKAVKDARENPCFIHIKNCIQFINVAAEPACFGPDRLLHLAATSTPYRARSGEGKAQCMVAAHSCSVRTQWILLIFSTGPTWQQRLVCNLGTLDGLILENHGTLTVGRSVAEAFMLMHILERAAQAQLRAMVATGGAIAVVSDELAGRTCRQWVGDGSEWDGDIEAPA